MAKKKLLLVSLSAGSGHVRAAQAIEKTAAEHFPQIETIHIDLADYLSAPLKKMILNTYSFVATKVPSFWRFFYKHTNDEEGKEFLGSLTELIGEANATKLYRFVKNINPDYVISTHSLASKLLIPHLSKNIPVSTVVTDYDIHEYWIVEGTHRYFVPSEKIIWKLKKKGIPYKKIIKSGIPVDPVFFDLKNNKSLRKQYKFTENEKIILVMGGGQGLGPTEDILQVLKDLTTSCTIVAITGNNEKLYKKLTSITFPDHVKVNIVGWTNNIDEYMRMADVIVSKPGGLTTTECLTLKKWLIAVMPIPGQEEVNAQYILDQHAGDVANTLDDLLYYVEQSLLHPKTPSTKITNGANIILNTITKQLQL